MRTLLILLCFAAGAPALAADDADMVRARELYENGARLYEEGLYEEAIEAFEASFELSGAHALWYNIANAQERLGRFQEALDALNRYRAFAPSEERPVLERRMRNLERRIEDQQQAPPPRAPAATQPVVTAPTPTPAPEPSGPQRRPSPANIALVATGGTLLVAGGATAAVTWQQSRTWKDEGDRQTWERWRPVNNLGFAGAVVGGGLLATGLLLPGKPVSATPIPGGVMATGRWRF